MRNFLVPRVGTVTKTEAEVAAGASDEAQRVPAGVSTDLQADSQVYDRRLRGRPQRRQSGEEQGCSSCSS